jgi:hypothetical protein
LTTRSESFAVVIHLAGLFDFRPTITNAQGAAKKNQTKGFLFLFQRFPTPIGRIKGE